MSNAKYAFLLILIVALPAGCEPRGSTVEQYAIEGHTLWCSWQADRRGNNVRLLQIVCVCPGVPYRISPGGRSGPHPVGIALEYDQLFFNGRELEVRDDQRVFVLSDPYTLEPLPLTQEEIDFLENRRTLEVLNETDLWKDRIGPMLKALRDEEN